MIRFFKSGLPSRYLAIFFLALALRIPVLLQNAPKPSLNYIPFYLGFAFPSDFSFPFQWLIAFVLVISTAVIINFMAIRHGFTEKSSTLAALFFILGSSVFPAFQPLNIYVVVTFLVALFFALTLGIQHGNSDVRTAFDAGLGLGIIILFYPEAMLLVLFIWAALISYRVSHWRPYFVSLLGAVTPFAFLFTGFFLFGSTKGLLPAIFSRLVPVFGLIHFPSVFNLIPGIILGLMVIVSVLQILSSLRSMSINVMQNIMTVLWGLLLIFIILTLLEAPAASAILICVPASFILANYFDSLNKLKWANLILIAFLVLIMVNNYHFLFYAS
jgi:hypothetical protein